MHSDFEGLKVISIGKEFQFLEVIGTNVLPNEVVSHFSHLTAKLCWKSAKRARCKKDASGGMTDLNSSEHIP